MIVEDTALTRSLCKWPTALLLVSFQLSYTPVGPMIDNFPNRRTGDMVLCGKSCLRDFSCKVAGAYRTHLLIG